MADVTRDGSGRWLPGAGSPNPAGRPSMPAAIREALEAATPKAVAKLVELMDDMDPRVALVACREIMDRTLGKASQAVIVDAAPVETDWARVQQAIAQLTVQHLEAIDAAEGVRDWSEVPTAALEATLIVGDAMRGGGGEQ